jgi:endo-1,4-beta-D-glucanase Y
MQKQIKRILALTLSLTMAMVVGLPALPTGASTSSAPKRAFPQAASNNLAVERVMPTDRTQAQMNNDVVLQFNKIIQDFIVDPNPDSANNPDTFRMVLQHTKGTGGANDAVTTSESMGYGMYMLALLAGAEDVIVDGTTRLRDNLKSNLPAGLRTALGTKEIDIQFYFDAMFRSLMQWPSFSIRPDGTASWGHSLDNGNRRTYLMVWQILQKDEEPFRSPFPGSSSSATDGDLDMAYALLLASEQWGNGGKYDYLTWAKGMIDDIWLVNVDKTSHHLTLGNWAYGGAKDIGTRPSDFMLHQLKVFDNFSDHNWQRVIDTCYDVIRQLTALQSTPNGLLPDFALLDRATGKWSPPEGRWHESANDGNFHTNACRTPWRMGIDTMFSGIASVEAQSNRAAKLVNDYMRNASEGEYGLIRGAQLDGTRRMIAGNCFSSPFLVLASIYGDAAWMTNGWEYARTLTRHGNFYGDYINVLCMIAASGNEWSPADTSKPTDPFDTASEWARGHITAAISKNFVPADIQNHYTRIITREEFCRMAVRWVEYATGKNIDAVLADQGKSRDPNAFTDTKDPDILAAFALGITSGTGVGIFNPSGQFSREQAATMIMNTVKALGADISAPDSTFADIGTAAGWAVPGISFVQANGIMSGIGNDNFGPKGAYTREQSIATFNNIVVDKVLGG